MNDSNQGEAAAPAADDFESAYSEVVTIEHRGRSKQYRFVELLESDAQAIFGDDPSKVTGFADQLVFRTVSDPDGTPMTRERFLKLPRAISSKIQMKALEVNGYNGEAETAAGEA